MKLTDQFPILIIEVPLIAAALMPIIGYWRRKWCMPFATLALSITSMIGYYLMLAVNKSGPISYHVGAWKPPFGIEIYFDHIAAFAFIIALFGLLIVIFSKNYAEHDLEEEKIPIFYTLVMLILTGMIGFTVTGDLFNLFVFMEVLSLSGYALIAISGQRLTAMASFKYLLVGAISSLSVLFGIAFLYSITGTLNMHDMAKMLEVARAPHVASVALTLFVLGFSVKAALFPLHIWLPDAHALAPSPVSAILSGLTVKMGIIGMIRIFFVIYGVHSAINVMPIMEILAWMAAAAIVFGAFFAFFQNDIKMMLAYSTISNIGYIILGLSVTPFDKSKEAYALVGSLVHVFNHAMIKVLLFLCAGAIIYRTGSRKLSDLQGIGKKMPITLAAMSIGVISIVGIPPTCGFTCKWFIALGAMEGGKSLFAALLLFGALFIFAYYIKILNTAYFREPTEAIANVKEAPLSMLIPIVILAAGCLVLGAGTLGFVPLNFIKPAALALLGR